MRIKILKRLIDNEGNMSKIPVGTIFYDKYPKGSKYIGGNWKSKTTKLELFVGAVNNGIGQLEKDGFIKIL